MKNNRNRLRILIALESYPPQIAGSGIATRRLAEGLSGRGHQVEIACPGNSIRYSKSMENGVTVHRVNSIPIPFHQEFRCSIFPSFSINRIFGEMKPDILHIADHLFVSRAACRAARKKGLNIIGTNHFTPYNWIPNLGVKDKPFIPGMVEKILWAHFDSLFRKIDVITTPTAVAREIIQQKGINREVKVLSNGIDLKRFSDRKFPAKELEKYGIDSERTIMISASRLDKEKRVDLLIDAMALIKNAADFQLVITGTGNDGELLKKRASDKGLSDWIIFTGVVPEGALRCFYSKSLLFVTASEVELQGLSIMEAMAAGLPVVAADSMAISELVRHGKNGYLFKPGNTREAADRILELLQNSSLRKEMSKNSLHLIQKHDFEKILDRLEDIYYENLDHIRISQDGNNSI